MAPDSSAFLLAYETVLDSEYKTLRADEHVPAAAETGFFLDAMRARDAAMAQFVPPIQARYNTAVLPGPDGTFYVYLLPAQPATDVFVVGDDVRYTYDAGLGAVVDERRLHDGHRVYDLRRAPGQTTYGRAVGVAPVETDVFYARSRPALSPDSLTHLVVTDDRVFLLTRRGVADQMTHQAFADRMGQTVDDL